jgi:hypothetical protein
MWSEDHFTTSTDGQIWFLSLDNDTGIIFINITLIIIYGHLVEYTLYYYVMLCFDLINLIFYIKKSSTKYSNIIKTKIYLVFVWFCSDKNCFLL